MKKLIFLSILAVLFSSCVRTYALSTDIVVGIQERGLPQCDEFSVTGILPFITTTSRNVSYDKFQNEINSAIEDIISGKIEDGINNRARSMSFSYTHETSGNIVSVLIYTTISLPGHTRQEVDSVNFDKRNTQLVNINAILGPNGTKLMNLYLSSLIRNDSTKYNLSFAGITDSHDFFTDGQTLYLLFDSYEITKGNPDIETVTVPLDMVKSYVLQAGSQKKPANNYSILLPLREICEYFGYEVNWRSFEDPISISRGSFNTEIFLNVNDYKKGSLNSKLESPPLFIEGTTYVPITFFDEILGLCYHADSDSLVTISEITLPASN